MDNNNEQSNLKKELLKKHLEKYYYHKGREINNDDILPVSRILPLLDEYADAKIAALQSVTLVEEKEPEAIEFLEWVNLTDGPKEEGKFIIRNIDEYETEPLCWYGETFKNKAGVIRWYNIPTELYSKYQWLKTKKYPSDAILFAEWINKEGYREYDGYDRWIAPSNNNNVYETKNLYKLFKNSKQ